MDLCKYKNALGAPGTGTHSIRVGNIAIVDVILTLVGALLITLVFGVNFFISAAILFLLGIVLHRLFCVRTTVDKALFP